MIQPLKIPIGKYWSGWNPMSPWDLGYCRNRTIHQEERFVYERWTRICSCLFNCCKIHLYWFERYSGSNCQSERYRFIFLYLVGNKYDLEEQRVVPKNEAQELSSNGKCLIWCHLQKHQPTSKNCFWIWSDKSTKEKVLTQRKDKKRKKEDAIFFKQMIQKFVFIKVYYPTIFIRAIGEEWFICLYIF